jgi:hypothetical protein
MQTTTGTAAAVRVAAVMAATLAGCGGDQAPTAVTDDARVVAQAVARPAALSAGAAFDIELTATNVTSAPIAMTLTSGCAFTYQVQTPAGQQVAAPQNLCTAVIRPVTLAPGEVLRETYRYETGDFTFPALAPGRYRVVPTVNVRAVPGLVYRAADIEVR